MKLNISILILNHNLYLMMKKVNNYHILLMDMLLFKNGKLIREKDKYKI